MLTIGKISEENRIYLTTNTQCVRTGKVGLL